MRPICCLSLKPEAGNLPDARAENSGILLKDIIYKVNDRIVNSTMDIEEALDEGYFKTNDEVKLLIIRKNNFIKVNLKLIDPYNK